MPSLVQIFWIEKERQEYLEFKFKNDLGIGEIYKPWNLGRPRQSSTRQAVSVWKSAFTPSPMSNEWSWVSSQYPGLLRLTLCEEPITGCQWTPRGLLQFSSFKYASIKKHPAHATSSLPLSVPEILCSIMVFNHLSDQERKSSWNKLCVLVLQNQLAG